MYNSTFSISTLFTLIGVLSTTITFVFAMFILRPIRLLSSDSSCSICCSSCGVSVHVISKPEIVEKLLSIYTPLFSQFELLNMLSSVAVNSVGEMGSAIASGGGARDPQNFWLMVFFSN